MYTSTDSNGEPVAVTGAYIEPSAQWKGAGPRPLVVVGSGTMGQGDQCAPSLALERPPTLTGRTVSFGYETLAVYRLLATGAAVVVTDYVGLGATDRLHTYVNRVDEGHAMLDAARAALARARRVRHRRLPGGDVRLQPGRRGQRRRGRTPALLRARRPARRHLQRRAARRSDRGDEGHRRQRAGRCAGLVHQRFRAGRAALRDVVEANLNDAGRKALKDISTTCVGDAILGYGFTRSTRWTKSGRSVGEIIVSEPAARAVLDDQRLGRCGPPARSAW